MASPRFANDIMAGSVLPPGNQKRFWRDSVKQGGPPLNLVTKW
jgi:hypothetical protein